MDFYGRRLVYYKQTVKKLCFCSEVALTFAVIADLLLNNTGLPLFESKNLP